MNKLMVAAVHLYHHKSNEAFELILQAFDGEYDPDAQKDPNPQKLWSWGLNRWGMEWSQEEYRIREEKDIDKQGIV
jgi:hypothetical protein